MFPVLDPAEWLMSLTEVMIGSQLQPTLSLLCDWPTETCIVPSVETAHGYNDLIYSVTCVNIFFSSVLPCLSLYFGLFISHYPALPLFFCCLYHLLISLFFWCSLFSVWLLAACGALISHMGQIRLQGVCVFVCLYAYTLIYALFPLALVLYYSLVLQ